MILKKQLNVLPIKSNVQIVESDEVVFDGTVEQLKSLSDAMNIVYLSSYVTRVYPLELNRFKILIKKKKEV